MIEYFELYRIMEDGEVEHIDQMCTYTSVFDVLYNHFQELRDYTNNPYCDIYAIELKRYLIKDNIGKEYVIDHFLNNHKDLNILEDESIEIRKISYLQYQKLINA